MSWGSLSWCWGSGWQGQVYSAPGPGNIERPLRKSGQSESSQVCDWLLEIHSCHSSETKGARPWNFHLLESFYELTLLEEGLLVAEHCLTEASSGEGAFVVRVLTKGPEATTERSAVRRQHRAQPPPRPRPPCSLAVCWCSLGSGCSWLLQSSSFTLSKLPQSHSFCLYLSAAFFFYFLPCQDPPVLNSALSTLFPSWPLPLCSYICAFLIATFSPFPNSYSRERIQLTQFIFPLPCLIGP